LRLGIPKPYHLGSGEDSAESSPELISLLVSFPRTLLWYHILAQGNAASTLSYLSFIEAVFLCHIAYCDVAVLEKSVYGKRVE